MLHCRIREHLKAMPAELCIEFTNLVTSDKSLTQIFNGLCVKPTSAKYVLSKLPALPDGPEKRRRQMYERLGVSPIGCQMDVSRRQKREGVDCGAWVTLLAGDVGRVKPRPIPVITGASGSGKTTYCGFQMMEDLTSAHPCPKACRSQNAPSC